MATMTYDDELARLAELNVRKCEFEHDDCTNTGKLYTNTTLLTAFLIGMKSKVVKYAFLDNFSWILTEKYPLVGQNIAMQLGASNTYRKSDLETLFDMASGWFENEYMNGEFWNWMEVINEFKLPLENDDDM